jgi:formamidopyrimidine-DNA glycosylase
MPEIAEVETVRQVLRKRIIKRQIKNVNILYDRIIESDLEEFKKIIPNLTFKEILRRGKWLIFDLDEYYLCSHLRMEGKYFIKSHDEVIDKHEHVIIELDDGYDLRYADVRKFGRMNLVKKELLDTLEGINKQGREPVDNDLCKDKLTKEYLYEKVHDKKLPLKELLLDQTIISGLGNIYADEVAFGASLNPLIEGNKLSLDDCQRIITSARKIISKAISEGGTTIRSYTSSLGVTGNYQNFLMVHKREGEPCLVCGNTIKRIKVGGRSTYYCPKCQK